MSTDRSKLKLILGSKQESATPVGPAEAAFVAKREKLAAINVAHNAKAALHNEVSAALADCKAKVDAPNVLRQRLEEAQAGVTALEELGVGTVDAMPLITLAKELKTAEKAAVAARPRLLVEKAKLARLDADIAALKAQQREAVAQQLPLGFACLWERLEAARMSLDAARSVYVGIHDVAFSLATAADKLARQMGTGQFAGGDSAGDLCLPIIAGMEQLPYTAVEHAQRRIKRAEEILREMGLA